MPRAEMGSTKQIANQMKSKGLQRLRWYCQACSRQMRDENGFKCHVASESHVRNMMIIGEDPRKAINDYSNQFQKDFIQLLRTGHGEKKVNVNHFYQEYIANKQHVHMNATKWPSLTEFAKFLGREGICRVEEDEKDDGRGGAGGLTISWVDNSPEALRRQDALRKKDRQDRGDEEREQRAIAEQIRRAREDGLGSGNEMVGDDEDAESEGIRRKDGEKIVLTFGAKKPFHVEKPPSPPLTEKGASPEKDASSPDDAQTEQTNAAATSEIPAQTATSVDSAALGAISRPATQTVSFGATKPKNVFTAVSKKNALSNVKRSRVATPLKQMSEAERIMKEEIERKRQREASGSTNLKKQRIS